MIRDEKGNWKPEAMECAMKAQYALRYMFSKYVGELSHDDVFFIIAKAAMRDYDASGWSDKSFACYVEARVALKEVFDLFEDCLSESDLFYIITTEADAIMLKDIRERIKEGNFNGLAQKEGNHGKR